MPKSFDRQLNTLSARALDDLLTNSPDVLDDLVWDWKIKGSINADQYGKILNQLIEERMVELTQRSERAEMAGEVHEEIDGPWEAA